MKKTRVFIADDHEVFRRGLLLLLSDCADIEVVGEAGTGPEVLRRAVELQPDVITMDVEMPGCDGIQATEQIRKQCPDTKVLALTAHDEPRYLRQLIAAGAAGFVLKGSSAASIVEAIRLLIAGERFVDPAIAKSVIEEFLHQNADGDLSGREKQVIVFVAQGLTNKQIASNLGISVKTVETYRLRLMRKLKLQSRADIVQFVRRKGWLEDSQP